MVTKEIKHYLSEAQMNPYSDIQNKLVEIFEANKNDLGINRVYSIIPLFLDADLYPIVTITKQTQSDISLVTTGVNVRRKIIFDIWLQMLEIDKNTFEKIKDPKEGIERIQRLENQCNEISWKISELLETKRGLQGTVLESIITGVDFRPRQRTSLSQSIVMGTVWSLQVETKNEQRNLGE